MQLTIPRSSHVQVLQEAAMTKSKKSPLHSTRTFASGAQTTARATREATQAEAIVKAARRQRIRTHLEARRTPGARPDGETALSADERRAMIEQAAYFRAEQRGFAPGHELEDWVAAELEVDQFLGSSAPFGPREYA